MTYQFTLRNTAVSLGVALSLIGTAAHADNLDLTEGWNLMEHPSSHGSVSPNLATLSGTVRLYNFNVTGLSSFDWQFEHRYATAGNDFAYFDTPDSGAVFLADAKTTPGNPVAGWSTGPQTYVFATPYSGQFAFSIESKNGLQDSVFTIWNVSVEASIPPVGAVPEPETYVMLLAGLGLMGVVARRRKQKSMAA